MIGHFRSLRRAIEEELKFQKAIAKACGSLDLLIQTSVVEFKAAQQTSPDSIFGEVAMHTIIFKIPEESSDIVNEEEINEIDCNDEIQKEKDKTVKIKMKDLPPIARESRKQPKGIKRLPKQ